MKRLLLKSKEQAAEQQHKAQSTKHKAVTDWLHGKHVHTTRTYTYTYTV